jgi:undecaprenyl-diphosphatase
MIKKIFKENIIYLLTIVALILLFWYIKESSLMIYVNNFDQKVISFINNISVNMFYPMYILSFIGNWYIPCILILLLFLVIKNKKYTFLMIVMYAFSGLVAFSSKVLISRDRPVSSLIDAPDPYSFPSGHTLTSICFYVMFVYILSMNFNKINKVFLFVSFVLISLLIGFSRIYLGVHYFSDVIGGIILSIPIILMFINIVNKNFKESL